jgi:hypothetical protein
MPSYLRLLLLLNIIAFAALTAQAQRLDRFQRKLEEQRSAEWQPERAYPRSSLGYVLQRTFKKHCEYCGFGTSNSRRDYVPQDISKFLGKRELRTRVETADIRGGGLLFYIFDGEERFQPFDEIAYAPSRIFRLNSTQQQFAVNPDENFDSFVLHKTCSGYLKAALDAGLEPPYTSFRAALDTDSRRESSVMALSGSFLSPLHLALQANDSRTTEAMMKLWAFYQENPQFVNNAYYLREFEGIMVRNVTSAEENFRIETEGNLNLNGPLPAHFKASLSRGRSSSVSFLGTDWETIIYNDFSNPYDKQVLFSPLPSPADIQRYFSGIQPVFQNAQDLPIMVEGMEHRHFLVVEGIPENMTSNFWQIEAIQPGVYETEPSLHAEPFQPSGSGNGGCRFTIAGKPLSSNYYGPVESRPSKLNVRYRIRSRQPVQGQYLSFEVGQEIQTSAHPVAAIDGGQFSLSKKEGAGFAFQWNFAIEIEDHYNPVDFSLAPYIGNLVVRNSDRELNVRLVKAEPNAQRRLYNLTLESLETFPLDWIDHNQMQPYNLSLDIHLKSKRLGATSVRPVRGILRCPAVVEPTPPPMRLAEPAAGKHHPLPLVPQIVPAEDGGR